MCDLTSGNTVKEEVHFNALKINSVMPPAHVAGYSLRPVTMYGFGRLHKYIVYITEHETTRKCSRVGGQIACNPLILQALTMH